MTGQIGGSDAARELEGLGSVRAKAAPIQVPEYQARLQKARDLLARTGTADALLVGAGTSLRYFSGVPWRMSERLVAMLLPRDGEPVFICPAFETGSFDAVLAARGQVLTWEEHENPFALVGKAARGVGAKTLALDPQLPLWCQFRLREAAPALELVDGSAIIDGCRMYKSKAELALIRQAMQMTLEVHRRAARMLRPGIGAVEVERFIDEAHRALGADNGSSFCIVSFGEGSAYPHGLPGEQFLKEGDVVLIDTGCQLHGYNSDITRTYVFGQPTEEQRTYWTLEREAQQAAFDAVRPGVPCEAVDAAARAVLEKAGLGPDYRLPGLPHRTGHGLGLDIHEPAYLVRGDRTPLAAGMCFSNEPMIVVPGKFGIRHEDHFFVTEDGAEWFTEPARSLEQPFPAA
ncbi:MAG TPA: Xaa-Pro peptidase family protein [Allosphingosinicella sp.]|uniref:M24 family metallopeptidase n=1 Tax=Allosphingosinicella sp. TaxID=2823234 RepID=UPI002ED85770